MTEQWTLAELVSEVAMRISALPAPKNGQVRAVPDDRTIRYYATLGLLDRPDSMRGRTAIYSRKHLAQIVAIKRMQTMGRSLAEIQALWPTLDDQTLSRMAGVALPITVGRAPARQEFWKREPAAKIARDPAADLDFEGRESSGPAVVDHERESAADLARGAAAESAAAEIGPHTDMPSTSIEDMAHAIGAIRHRGPDETGLELRIELAPNVSLVLAIVDEHVSISPAEVRAIRAAAAPLIAELAQRRLTTHAGGEP